MNKSQTFKVIISHKYKLIFFSNPKTGSESIRKFLSPISEEKIVVYRRVNDETPFYSHITPLETKLIFDKKGLPFTQYNRLVFIRNTFDRILSLFKMLTRNRDFDKELFNRWVSTIDNKGAGGGGNDLDRWRKYGTYSIYNFINNENGNPLVTKIIRLEDVEKDLIKYLTIIGVPKLITDQSIPFINKSGKIETNILEKYSDKNIDRMLKLYGKEISEFGYGFE